MSDVHAKPGAESIGALQGVADLMDANGMTISKRDYDGSDDTFVGYRHQASPARFFVPPNKDQMLDAAMAWLIGCILFPLISLPV